jgi:nucleoside-triphosphatase THEP1
MFESMSESPIILITGPKFSGKSSFIEQLVKELRDAGFKPAGYFQRGLFDENGRNPGYQRVSIHDATTLPLAHRKSLNSQWVFNDSAFKAAADKAPSNCDVFVLDEVGPLELSGKGHASLLANVCNINTLLVLVVREELSNEFATMLPGSRKVTIIRFVPGEEEELAKRITGFLKA